MLCSGSLVIFSSPSGGGKTSLIKQLVKELPYATKHSISFTTRAPRENEVDGKDYYFISQERFEEKIRHNDFLEYAKVFDYYYGTCRQQIKDNLAQGVHVFLDIDWQGARQLRDAFDDVISIFVLPPNKQVLWDRLVERKQDSQEIIDKRMAQAQSEMRHFNEFDYVIVNDDFQQTVLQLKAIMQAEMLKMNRQKVAIHDMISDLLLD